MNPDFVVQLSDSSRIAFYKKENHYMMLYEYLSKCSLNPDLEPIWDDGYAGDFNIKIPFSEFPAFVKGFSRLEKLILLK